MYFLLLHDFVEICEVIVVVVYPPNLPSLSENQKFSSIFPISLEPRAAGDDDYENTTKYSANRRNCFNFIITFCCLLAYSASFEVPNFCMFQTKFYCTDKLLDVVLGSSYWQISSRNIRFTIWTVLWMVLFCFSDTSTGSCDWTPYCIIKFFAHRRRSPTMLNW